MTDADTDRIREVLQAQRFGEVGENQLSKDGGLRRSQGRTIAVWRRIGA